MADHLRAGLCVDALVMALRRCQPPRGLIHHSDSQSALVSNSWAA
jgi:putative transposase